MSGALLSLWPLSFLAIAVIDDLCFKKFHNGLFVLLSLAGFGYALLGGPLTLLEALSGFFTGGFLMLPLVLARVVGAGDLKFMMSFATIIGTFATINIIVYSFFWGALIGLLQVLLSGQFQAMLKQLKDAPSANKKTHKIPYTVAILFGWLSYINVGGLL